MIKLDQIETLPTPEERIMARGARAFQMQLRDQFAMVALQGILACEGPSMEGYETQKTIVAYRYADAMLKTRGE